jgi:cell division protein FtsW (lipid II flippase)
MKNLNPRNREAVLLAASIAIVGCYLYVLGMSGNPSVAVRPLLYLVVATSCFAAVNIANRLLAPSATALLTPCVALLHGIGYLTIARLAPDKAQAQLLWTAASAAAYVAVLWLLRDYRALDRYRYLWALGAVLALAAPFMPLLGREINGSRLWIAVGPFSFQPGEIAKVLLVFFFSSYLLERSELLATSTTRVGPLAMPHPRHLAPVLALWLVSFGILVIQRDLGSSLLVFAIFLILLYVATGRLLYQFAGLFLFSGGLALAYALFGHVRTRFSVWLDPFATYESTGFQIAQSLFSLGTGGIFGTGPGKGNPNLVPLAYSDFVFAAAGEELGLVGLVAILCCYALVFVEGMRIALSSRNPFGQLVAAGLSCALGLQAVVVIAGVIRLLPLTGLTTPFLSYGGSSLVANFVAIAVLAAVSDQRDRPAPEQI